MGVESKVIQNAEGRFFWRIQNLDLSIPGKTWQSIMVFGAEGEAQKDLEQFLQADRDATGRVIKTKDEIQDLIRNAAETCNDCAGATFGEIQEHEPDNDGCNWTVTTIRGGDTHGCLDCFQPMAIKLRDFYNISTKR